MFSLSDTSAGVSGVFLLMPEGPDSGYKGLTETGKCTSGHHIIASE